MDVSATQNRLFNSPKKAISERASLLEYFLCNALDRKGRLKPARMGMLLAHLKIEDLYYMKSVLESEIRRGGNWNKIFWGMLKKVDNSD